MLSSNFFQLVQKLLLSRNTRDYNISSSRISGICSTSLITHQLHKKILCAKEFCVILTSAKYFLQALFRFKFSSWIFYLNLEIISSRFFYCKLFRSHFQLLWLESVANTLHNSLRLFAAFKHFCCSFFCVLEFTILLTLFCFCGLVYVYCNLTT